MFEKEWMRHSGNGVDESNRYPICYIDYVEDLVLGEKIAPIKKCDVNESFFRVTFKKSGHARSHRSLRP